MQTLLLAITLWLPAAPPAAQTPTRSTERPESSAAISGVVIDGTSGDPVENATVSIAGTGATGLLQTRQFTDAKGRFVFPNLTPGLDYTFTASAPGYFSGSFSRDGGPTDQKLAIPVKANEWVKDVRVTVWKPGSISGRVVDEHGDPMASVYVRAIGRVMIAGREQLVNGALAVTDDRGMYRIPGLNAGRYVVEVPSVQAPMAALNTTPVVSPSSYGGVNGAYPWAPPAAPDGRPRGYPITFYPSASSVAEAAVIDVNLAEERSGADITLTPVSLFKVSGKVVGPADGLLLRLVPVGLEALGQGSEAASGPIDPDGSFAFIGVPAGNYTLDARRRTPEFTMTTATPGKRLPTPSWTNSSSTSANEVAAAPPLIGFMEAQFTNFQTKTPSLAFARQSVTVSTADLAGLQLQLRASATMDGTIELDVAPNAPDAKPRSIPMGLEPANGQPDLGVPFALAAQNIFHFDGLRNGEYLLRPRVPGWVVKSIAWNGEDYTHRPFDASATTTLAGVALTLTNRVATITGSVKEKNAAIIVFPADPSRWAAIGFAPADMRTTSTGVDGAFRFGDLPAGDYMVVAVEPRERMAWIEPGFFGRMTPFASRVSVGWGESQSVTLSVAAVRR